MNLLHSYKSQLQDAASDNSSMLQAYPLPRSRILVDIKTCWLAVPWQRPSLLALLFRSLRCHTKVFLVFIVKCVFLTVGHNINWGENWIRRTNTLKVCQTCQSSLLVLAIKDFVQIFQRITIELQFC
jgi:hypothetical protein